LILIAFVDCFRHIFAYTESMKVQGHERVTDWPKMGPSVLIATALIVAIRTAKWVAKGGSDDKCVSDVDVELDEEVRFAARISMRVMHELLGKHADMFPQKLVPRWEPTDEDVME
jgi:hypothetical protein